MTDETLGTKPASTPLTDGIRDVGPDASLSAETFDFAAFVTGAKPTRRAVTLYARADLKAQLDRIGEDIELAARAGNQKKVLTLRKQAEGIVEQMTAPGAVIDVVVEGRSDDWIARVEADLDEQGVTDATEKVLRRVAAQIVEPAGVTYELLEQFRRVSEPQVKKVVVAATLANTQPVSVDAPFLRGSTAKSGGRGSSSR
ncbi:hypothetical protein SAMN05216184_10499 [Georgenia satyanarayanai]|uniref:Uncharacterized protein n=1 Tax=Georgenia satyanarayanai TaxID=860221 RepID=A0A2Y9ACS9_9MICO|nr:hypothetical protein [Georgenia satyanarayanai]PYG00160.1 hypothetical protein A8987_10499 [Georgenia satyanarayanai]SSA40379.1 hypothetical protein SAMN05216184_10499 [Georgenia satyanarayanai]